MLINPTLACADRLNLARDLDTLAGLGTRILHMDIMDGHYVPNFCFDIDTIAAVAGYSQIPLDVHMMTDDPEHWLERLAPMKPRFLSFHVETVGSPFRMADKIRRIGSEPGIVLNPSDRVENIAALLPRLALIQVMGVEPGFAGQSFMEHTLNQVKLLHRLRQENGFSYVISVDGGVNLTVARQCKVAGADIVVAGALAIFSQVKSLAEAYREFEAGIEMEV